MPETKQEQAPTKKRRPIRKLFKSFVDVKKWSSYDEVSANTRTTLGLFRRLIYRRSGEIRQETYEEAVTRLNLTPDQIVARKKSFLYSSFVYGLFAIGFLIYFIYLIINIRLLAASLTLLLMVLMSLITYREHFWYMQMERKKLGCGFKDWLDFILGRSKK